MILNFPFRDKERAMTHCRGKEYVPAKDGSILIPLHRMHPCAGRAESAGKRKDKKNEQ
jgi:hypothetical protein